MSRDVVAYGIDVSEHNGQLSFSTMNPVPSFVILRGGYGEHTDSRANSYRLQLENLGIPYGVYWYSYSLNTEQAKKEAEYCLNLIKNWHVQCGVWFDMEDSDNYKANRGVTSASQISAICDTFCSIVEDAGYYCGIYASLSWFGTKIVGLDRFDKWVAWWGTPNDGLKRTDTSTLGTMQQYSSTFGRMDKDCVFVPLSTYDITPKPKDKSLDEYAVEVWEGKWGTGSARKKALDATTYGYNKVQNRVNEYGKVAKEVWKGKYGNGAEREEKLEAQGWNPYYVQRVVNVIAK